jgi:hypothetical protein
LKNVARAPGFAPEPERRNGLEVMETGTRPIVGRIESRAAADFSEFAWAVGGAR